MVPPYNRDRAFQLDRIIDGFNSKILDLPMGSIGVEVRCNPLNVYSLYD